VIASHSGVCPSPISFSKSDLFIGFVLLRQGLNYVAQANPERAISFLSILCAGIAGVSPYRV
jgi:hypothetical protein